MTDRPMAGPTAPRTVHTQCMNWQPYTLPQIWQMLEHETGQTSWAQVTAWGRMKNLCEAQASQLRRALDELAALWPPEQSEASRAYRDVVLTMVQSLDDSANAAHANAKALSSLTIGISNTRQQIAHLVDELHTREAEQAQREQTRLPFWPDSGLIDTQRTELNREAQRVMEDADVIPATAAAEFRAPGRFGFSGIFPEQRTVFDPGAGSDANTPGVVRFGSVTSAPVPGGMSIPYPVFDAPPPTTANGGEFDREEPVPPVLSGTEGSMPPPATIWLTPDPSPAAGTGRGGPGAVIYPGVIGPGGVINPPRSAATEPSAIKRGSPAGTSRGAPSPSSSPGLIAPMAPPVGHGNPSSGRSIPIGGARRRVNGNEYWGVPQGRPGILEPPPEPPIHDPGPGVIGIDR